MASLVYNKKAKFNYEILETYSAGIELLGFEVKSIFVSKRHNSNSAFSMFSNFLFNSKNLCVLYSRHVEIYFSDLTFQTKGLVRGGEVYVVGLRIPPFQVGNTDKEYDPVRTRKLLMTKKEIRELGTQSEGKGLTLVPIELYTKGVHIKVAVALVRGKKLHDKRETIKKRDLDREMRRSLK